MKITIETKIAAPVAKVWAAWIDPEAIKQWNAASADWHTTAASVDLRLGGKFTARMEAKDGSVGFDFFGTYTKVIPEQLLEYTLGDERRVQVKFSQQAETTTVTETFETESVHSAEQQRLGWQAILDNFANYVQTTA